MYSSFLFDKTKKILQKHIFHSGSWGRETDKGMFTNIKYHCGHCGIGKHAPVVDLVLNIL